MKLLVLLSRFPYPLEKGDKLRAFHQIRHLSQHNEIILFALSEYDVPQNDIAQLAPFCTDIYVHTLSKIQIGLSLTQAFFSDLPLQVGYFYDQQARKKLQQIVTEKKPDLLYCQLLRTVPYVLDFPEVPKVLDYQDVFSAGVERRMQNAAFYMKPVLKLEYKRLLAYENEVFQLFDQKTIITEQDRELIQHPKNKQIHIIPNGVDTDFFRPLKIQKEYDLVFTGNMSYPPNISAVVFLAEQVLPLIQKQFPDIKLLIAGASPVARIRALASENITVSGWVDDIRKSYSASRIFIAPMQIGTGLQNKLLEAMAMQLPCITSNLANNALGATPGKQVLLGETPEEYAQQIKILLNDPERVQKLAAAGQEFVHKNYNWQATTNKLQNLMEQSLHPVKT